jgi:hypothetical protein
MRRMKRFSHPQEMCAAPAEVGMIADHFRLPWRFHARIVASRGHGLG